VEACLEVLLRLVEACLEVPKLQEVVLYLVVAHRLQGACLVVHLPQHQVEVSLEAPRRLPPVAYLVAHQHLLQGACLVVHPLLHLVACLVVHQHLLQGACLVVHPLLHLVACLVAHQHLLQGACLVVHQQQRPPLALAAVPSRHQNREIERVVLEEDKNNQIMNEGFSQHILFHNTNWGFYDFL
jgi:hypothetical protein